MGSISNSLKYVIYAIVPLSWNKWRLVTDWEKSRTCDGVRGASECLVVCDRMKVVKKDNNNTTGYNEFPMATLVVFVGKPEWFI